MGWSCSAVCIYRGYQYLYLGVLSVFLGMGVRYTYCQEFGSEELETGEKRQKSHWDTVSKRICPAADEWDRIPHPVLTDVGLNTSLDIPEENQASISHKCQKSCAETLITCWDIAGGLSASCESHTDGQSNDGFLRLHSPEKNRGVQP